VLDIGRQAGTAAALAGLGLGLLLLGPGAAQAHTHQPTATILEKAFAGDLPELRARGVLRVLVTCDRTNFFIDRGRPRGFEYELMRAYEQELNRDVSDPHRRLRVVFVPVPKGELFDALRQGRGDVVAAGLKIPARVDDQVAATDPYVPHVPEVVVTRAGGDPIGSLEDLAGRPVHVAAGSAQFEHLRALSRRLVASGAAPILIRAVDPRLLPRDILERVDAGDIERAVVDAPLARLWARKLPNLVVREDLVVHREAGLAWAARRDNPRLLSSLNGFLARHGKGSLLGNVLYARYYERNPWIGRPAGWDGHRNLQPLLGLFRKYGERYGVDWLAIAAQAYQESHLRHDRVSPAGAVGIMQVRPSTARDPRVGIADIEQLDNNVHAGVKYLHLLRERYFDEPGLTAEDRLNFIWAAYNAGPTRIQRLRREAARSGLDPDRWFGHVEQIAARRIGRETVEYVANINKYYLAYRLAREEAPPAEWRVASSE